MTVRMKVKHKIEIKIQGLPQEVHQDILSDLTLDNPEYLNALKYGFYTGKIREKIFLYRSVIDKGTIIMPRGYGSRLLKKLNDAGIEYEIIDERILLPEVDFGSQIKLKDYQTPAVEKLVYKRQGGVIAPSGSGKTEILLECMARIKQPALWICHTYELLYQTLERACRVLDISKDEVGIIAGGQVTVGSRLTLALIQTLHKVDLENIKDSFGAIIIDEAHHLVATTFFETVNKFPALYRIWASATPERGDGLSQMVYVAGGPVNYQINYSELPLEIPELVTVETTFSSQKKSYNELIQDLINDNERNQLVCKTIAEEAPGNYSLVLSEREDHLKTLEAMLQKALPDLRIEVLRGQKRSKKRQRIIQDTEDGNVDILIATQLAREGLEIPRLNRLFLVTPKKAESAVEQEVGRIMSPYQDKSSAKVFDFWDVNSPILKSQFWNRRNVYNRMGIKWTPSHVRRKN